MKVKIIDRTSEEKDKDFERAFAEGLDITVEELRDAIEQMEEYEEECREHPELCIEWCHGELVGRILLGGSFRKLMNKGR